jgi:hypothetical protein
MRENGVIFMDSDNPGPLPDPAHRWALMAVLYALLGLVGIGALFYDALVQKDGVDGLIVVGTVVALTAALGNWQLYRRTHRTRAAHHILL